MIKRYQNRIVMDECGPHDELRENPNGDWVQASDYDAAIALLQTAHRQILTWCNLYKAGELSAEGAFAQIKIDAERCLPSSGRAEHE